MKIMLVVGSLFPFDRLVRLVDTWASGLEGIKVIGQIGKGNYLPVNIESYPLLRADEFNRIFNESDLVVTHAGMGIILKSLVAGKPIVVLPRQLALKEINTDHQMATAKALERMGYVHVAWTNEELQDYLKKPSAIGPRITIGEFASERLLESIRSFISINKKV
jgi:UDP-N-acetylglucosamine transferase subunit ALG13